MGIEEAVVTRRGKKRGRKPRSEVGSSILREVLNEEAVQDPIIATLQASVSQAEVGSYFTRATKAWVIGKFAGMEFPGTDAKLEDNRS